MPAELISRRTQPSAEEPACFFIIPAPPEGWSQVALGEWELHGSEFGDRHQHDEVNYVLDGRLIVECDGERGKPVPGMWRRPGRTYSAIRRRSNIGSRPPWGSQPRMSRYISASLVPPPGPGSSRAGGSQASRL